MAWSSRDAQVSWAQWVGEDPGRSSGYVERIRAMAARGDDLGGEAHLVHALVAPASRVLDAGCGPGRVARVLADLGHTVVGVDLDPVLIEAARSDHPDVRFEVADLATLTLDAVPSARHDAAQRTPFDAAVCAGNVLPFMEAGAQRAGLAAIGSCVRPGGRLAVGFQTDRGYGLDEFLTDARAAGWLLDARFSSWDMRAARPGEAYVVGVFTRA